MSSPTQRLSSEVRDDRAEILFYEALKQPAEVRESFLEEQCGEDDNLRAEVGELLRDYEKAAGFLSADAPVSDELAAEFARLKPEEAGDRIGPYKLLEQIGEGGFGRVWVAEQDRPIRRRVALKIIKLGMDTRDVIARFEQERQVLALLDHPNVARVFDAGATPSGRPFFVMELVRGVRITDYCDQAKLPTEERLQLFMQLCRGVHHAHQKGIIHRDLKPSNILVTVNDGVPVLKVIDFGVAKATQQRLSDLTVYTQFHSMIGTPIYMAPEQAGMSSVDVDIRSDIYTLGVLLYELITSSPPFSPQRLLELGYEEMRRVLREDEPHKPSELLSTMDAARRETIAEQRGAGGGSKLIEVVRGDLDWIVMKALEKDRNRRYDTAIDFARDVERHLNFKPVVARPPSISYRFKRFVRRNRVAVGTGAAVVLALVAGVMTTVWQAVRAHRGELLAQKEAYRANAALSELRKSAPAFIDQARFLIAQERFSQALEKIDYAIQLCPDSPEYLLAKGNVLQGEFRFDEAAEIYRAVLRLEPLPRARTHLQLCEKLAKEMESKVSRESLVELLTLMKAEQRPPAEMLRTAKQLGKENELLLSYWRDRLSGSLIESGLRPEDRLTISEGQKLTCDLSGSGISDLTPLHGMPLALLDLRGCDRVSDLRPLQDMPLETLIIDGTEVVDLAPLRALKDLSALSVASTKVQDLSPLSGLRLSSLNIKATRVADLSPLIGLPLRQLDVSATSVSDITPIAGLPLRFLSIARTAVTDLTPLRGLPLQSLNCSGIKARDFTPLANLRLSSLNLGATAIADLTILRGMPLKELSIHFCVGVYNLKVLGEMPTLEDLLLHKLSSLRQEEFSAVAALRNHPTLRLIGADQIGPSLRKEIFWEKFKEVEESRVLRGKARQMARQGEYAMAAKLLSDEKASSTVGILLAASGDHGLYTDFCQNYVKGLKRRLNGDEVAVRVCVLRPDCGVPMATLRRLMPHMELVGESTVYRCWYLLTNGLLEYRAGRMQKAIEYLTAVSTDDFDNVLCAAAAGLAMANFRLGDMERANAYMEHARTLFESVWRRTASADESFHEWVFASLLLREAESLIGSIR